MTTDQREQDIIESFVGFADRLIDDVDVLDLTTQLARDCVRLLDVAAAGLLLADPGGVLHLLAATSEDVNFRKTTVFGDFSIAVNCARNLSTQSTTSPSRTTVADSTPDDISTRCTRTLLVMNTRDSRPRQHTPQTRDPSRIIQTLAIQ
jgi:hypothetical protein